MAGRGRERKGKTMIEPSDVERAAWPDATLEYVEDLKRDLAAMNERAEGYAAMIEKSCLADLIFEVAALRELRDTAQGERAEICAREKSCRAALREERITSMRLRGEIYRLRDVVTAPDVEAIDELLADLPCVVQAVGEVTP